MGLLRQIKEDKMLAQEVIERCVVAKYQDRASVRAHIVGTDTWWHIHKDEEIPTDKPVSVIVYFQAG